MKKNLSIRIKAATLLLVFSLNAIISVACSMGLEMGFNATHHHGDEAMETMHSPGGQLRHQKEVSAFHPAGGKENCCHDKILQFAQITKVVAQTFHVIYPAFSKAFIAQFYLVDISFIPQSIPNIKQFVRSHHPPIPDIRIAIQSFQI